MRSAPQSSPEHWSKDFVEHLRTVHFALLSVSAGLILLLSSKHYDAKVASSQMSEIIQMRDKLSKDVGSLRPDIRKYFILSSSLSNAHPTDRVSFSAWFDGTPSADAVRKINGLARQPRKFHLAGPNWFLCFEKTFDMGRTYHQLVPPTLFNTITDFTYWWDVIMPSGVAPIDSIVEIDSLGDIADFEGHDAARSMKIKPTSIGSSDPIELRLEDKCAAIPLRWQR